MLLVVVAGDLILLLVGWEVMGLCSYLLIGHDRRLPEAPAAAMKAFLVTRVGDVGFLLGIALLGVSAGSFRIADVLAHDHSGAHADRRGLLLLAGVAGKSAQFPLHTWLPDAMAGPTPISALIHAATMVAAGVYVVARLYPLFAAAPAALTVLGVHGRDHACCSARSPPPPRTTSNGCWPGRRCRQLGYMTGALAVGSPSAALFHLLTHAAFKALLFLAAGAVIHAVGTNLMSRDGRAARAACRSRSGRMTIGLGALAGVPPLAGFWSKDDVLDVAESAARRAPARPRPGWAGWSGSPGWSASRSPPGTPPGCCCAPSSATPAPAAGHAARPAGRDALAGAAAGRAGRAARPRRVRPGVRRPPAARTVPAAAPRRPGPPGPAVLLPLAFAAARRGAGGAGLAARPGRRPGRGAGSAAAGLRQRVLARRRPARPRGTPGRARWPAPSRAVDEVGGGRRGRGHRPGRVRARRGGWPRCTARRCPGPPRPSWPARC